MTEHWKPIFQYHDRYQISDRGGVWSETKNRPMTPYRHAVGYLAVGLWDGDHATTRYVHDLVAQAFLGDRPSPGHEVRHLDGDPLNNSVDNLAWGTRAENMRDAVRHGTHHQSSKTCCKRGHEFTPENTQIINSQGHRRCRTCTRAARYVRRSA